MTQRHNLTAGQAIAGVLIGFLFFLAILAIGGLVVLLVWNYILVPVVAALGGSVPTIGFWVALGISFLLSFIRGAISG